MTNAINWFEIPVEQLDRAVKFYETMLATSLKQENFGGIPMAIFPTESSAVTGALVLDSRRKPSGDGSLVYINTTGKLDECLERIGRAGGQVVAPKMDIGAPGFIAIVRDSEGNIIGLHAERV